MEKLLDRPRAYEESKLRYIAALEAQKRSQILVISNAQRKLVSNFQRKLKSSATVSDRHKKWIHEAKTAKQDDKNGKEDYKVNYTGRKRRQSQLDFCSKDKMRNMDMRKKSRPKTTGAMLMNKGMSDIRLESNDTLHEKETVAGYLNYKSLHEKCRKEADHSLDSDDLHIKIRCYGKRHNETNIVGLKTSTVCKGRIDQNKTITPEQMCGGREETDRIVTVFGTGNLNVNKNISMGEFYGEKKARKRLMSSRGFSAVASVDFEESNDNIIRSQRAKAKVKVLQRAQTFGSVIDSANESKELCFEDFKDSREDSGKLTDVKVQGPAISFKSDSERCLHEKGKFVRQSFSADEIVSSERRTSGKIESRLAATEVDCTDDFETKRKMPYELRKWISNINKDVCKIESCMIDGPSIAKNEKLQHEIRSTSVDSADSGLVLERFTAIFQDLNVHGDADGCEFQGKREKVDVTSLYANAAVLDSKLDSSQNWHRRDPRNQKLKPSIFL